MESLIKKRGSVKGRLTMFKNYLDGLQSLNLEKISDQQINELNLRMVKLDSCLANFEIIQTEIEQLSDNSDEQCQEREDIENNFFYLMSCAQTLVDKLKQLSDRKKGLSDMHIKQSSSCDGGSASVNSSIKLPTIKLPMFDGNYNKWLEYRDTFDSLINKNDSIDNVNKFHYLRASLEGSAAIVIKSLEFCSENYFIAWDLLCERYNNKSLLISNHMTALFEIEFVSKESDKSLRFIIDHVYKNIRSLKALGLPVEYWDTMIIHFVVIKLDTTSKTKWEEYKGNLSEIPTLDEFFQFLRNRANVLESVKSGKHVKNYRELCKASFITATQGNNQSKYSRSCILCKQEHGLYECPKFKTMNLDERNHIVSKYKLCINCFKHGHFAINCRLGPCKICKCKHNTLMHRNKVVNSSNDKNIDSSSAHTHATNTRLNDDVQPIAKQVFDPCALSVMTAQHVLLCTALVEIVNNISKERIIVRALLDCGSQITIITKSLCSKLSIYSKRCEQPIGVTGISNIKVNIFDYCNFTMNSLTENYSVKVNSMIVPSITSCLPKIQLDINSLGIPSNIKLADPQFYNSSEIDLLIGADFFWDILYDNKLRLGKNKPILQSSKLGWLVAGPIGISTTSNINVNCQLGLDVSKQLQRFWEIEEINSENTHSSINVDFCENHFVKNTYRLDDGSFCVKIPFHTSPNVLGDSLSIAKSRFFNLEKRFKKQPLLKDLYVKFIREYEELNHLTPISRPQFGCYLPHHPVLREKSETTKLRVVFDASVKTSTGKSLNDLQMVGPIIQDDLFSILIRFRQHHLVFTADIAKMYRCVSLNKEQRNLQTILWRENESEPLQYLQLNTVTYGMASAPFLSTRCLLQLAKECEDHVIKTIIEHDFYVDDILTGANTISDLIRIRDSVVKVLQSAGFHLRKFRSNSKELLKKDFNTNNQLICAANSVSNTLGLLWLPEKDLFHFIVKIQHDEIYTKRKILSAISKIFDPLGLLSIFVIKAKIILQRLWLSKLNWDDPIDSETNSLWLSFVKNINTALNIISIPRHVICTNVVQLELHIFSDASQSAYGTCVYARSTDSSEAVHVRLLCAKSRVAPLKKLTIPRLELCGALLAAEIGTKVTKALRCNICRCVYWTDSMVVIGWINRSGAKKYNIFVENRVNKIKQLTKQHEWRYVSTDNNPADLISRGVDHYNSKLATFWWEGPMFLKDNSGLWPPQIRTEELPYTFTDETDTVQVNFIKNIKNNKLIDWDRYSTLNKLKRVMSYILRFINNCQRKYSKLIGKLSVDELQKSIIMLVKLSQREGYNFELQLLQSGKSLPNKSIILSLNPFLDKLNIIRVGGRIHNSSYSYDKKHPMLLDSRHRLSKLLFEAEHKRLLHAGPQLLLASIRERYWVVNARQLARSIPHNCIICRRCRGKTLTPLMGNLPKQRLMPAIPFETSGVDFAGPFFIADRKGRGCKISKCYLCIFVCFATKALHLEAVSDLSKECFILTLKRFIARRGKPSCIYCDNGTNFVGANNELNRFMSNNNKNIKNYCINEGIKFIFSPAYSPNFGGLWEAGVKSAKFHLKRILGDRHLTYEELSTLFVQIEAILNSRPLCPMSSNPNDLNPLTPGHFLIGKPLMSLPSPPLTDININRLHRYEQLEQMKQHFWNRWQLEYVAELQQRNKWKLRQAELKIGDMVVVKEQQLPPLKWRIGRITATFPGSDGIIRVADISTSTGIIRRALNRLCPLFEPVLVEDSSSTGGDCSRANKYEGQTERGEGTQSDEATGGAAARSPPQSATITTPKIN